MGETVSLSSVLETVDLGGMERAIRGRAQVDSAPDGLWLHFQGVSVKIDVPRGRSPTLGVSSRVFGREVLFTAVKQQEGWKNLATEKWHAEDDLQIPSAQARALQQLKNQWNNYGGVDLNTGVGYAEGGSSGQVGSVSLEIVPADLRLAIQYGILGQADVKEAANPQLDAFLTQMGLGAATADWTASLLPGRMSGQPQINELCQQILQVPGNTNKIKDSHRAAAKSELGINLDLPFNPREYLNGLLK